MKKAFLLFIVIVWHSLTFAQNSPGFKYQALVRDENGVVLTKQAVSLQINIMQGLPVGDAVYSETFSVTTNDYGLINLVIGQGSTLKDFNSINWANGPYFVEILMDVHGGTNYQLFGTSELLSVPYALHAKTAESVENLTITETDPIFSSSVVSDISDLDIKNWNAVFDWGNHQIAGYVTLDGIETLTNKTLTSPIILSPSGILKADVGLEKVDNTADLEKPISIATQGALDLKEDLINKSNNESLTENSDKLYPTQFAVKTYVDQKNNTIDLALKEEISRALAAEAVLATDISTNETAIADETARAIAAETANSTAIKDEQIRAEAAEVANATAILDEETRALAAEAILATDISTNATAITTETARAIAAETTNATAIVNETTRATAAEGVLTTNIAAETTRATAAEAVLATDISTNATAITTEKTRAIAAEAILATDISANETAITAETTRATTAEGVLTTNIATNTTAITTEKTRALAAEAVLATDISTNETAIANETSRAIAAEAVNASVISNETTRALTAEAANATAIMNEITAREAKPANGITTTDITNWNTAYGWGDHSTEGYLTSFSETDPIFAAWNKSTGISITESQISDLKTYELAFTKNTAFNKNFGTAAGTVAEGNDSRILNGQTAYGWGNHALAGYLKTYTETDPIFVASASYGITSTDISNWNTSSGITSTDISNWNTAYGWGNHALAGYLKTYTETDPIFSAWNKSTGISITESQISDLKTYELAFTKNTAFNKNFGTAAGTVAEGNDSRILNGQTAYGWGNHATMGYLTSLSETDPTYTASAAAGITSTNITNWNTAFGWGNHATAGYLTVENNNTLDKAYDQGGAGAGKTIVADAGALTINGTDGIISTGTFGSGSALATSGAGTRMMWYPAKSSFRAGAVTATEWDDANIGNYTIGLGYKVTASGDYSTAIGHTATASGDYTSAIGYKVTASGPNSTALGNYVSTGSVNGSFGIGDNSTTAVMTITTANQMNMRFDGGYKLYTNAAADLGVYLANNANSWASISDSTKKENIVVSDGEYFLNSISKMRIGSWNYKVQNSKYRHYGPMAQDIFHYFGNDGLGIIGNDTTLSSADMDGIMMIAIKALEKRTQNTAELNNRVSELENAMDKLSAVLEEQTSLIKSQQALIDAYRKELEK